MLKQREKRKIYLKLLFLSLLIMGGFLIAEDALAQAHWADQGEGSFNITAQPPNAPSSLSQKGLGETISWGGTTYDLTPTFYFTQSDPDSGKTVKYRIQIDDNSDFSSPVIDYTSILLAQGSTSFEVGQAAGGGTYTVGSQGQELTDGSYYWRVRSENSSGVTGSWSTANSGAIAFKVDTTPQGYWDDQGEGSFNATAQYAPNAPSLSSPTDGATGVSTTPSLQLSATDPNSDNLKYKIELALNNTFTSGLQTFDQTSSQTGWSGQNADSNTTYTSGTTATYTLQSSLSPGTTYYWRAYAIDPSGSNTWSSASSIRSFTTEANSRPNAPSLSLPADGATEVNPVAQFQISTTDPEGDNLKYKIEIAKNPSFTMGLQIFDQTSSQTGWSGQNADSNTTYTSGSTATYTMQTALSYTTTYYWRAYAIDPAGSNTWSSASSTRYFTTGSEDFDYPGEVSEVGLIPEDGAIRIKWKNPSDSDLAKINIYQSTVFGSLGSLISSPAATPDQNQFFTASGLTNETTYYFTFRPVDAEGNVNPTTTQYSETPHGFLFDLPIALSGGDFGDINTHRVKVSIPAGVFSDENKQIRARSIVNFYNPPGNMKIIGPVRDLIIVDDQTCQEVTTFTQPLTITLPYDQTEIDNNNLREDTLRIAWWDEANGVWSQEGLSNQMVDTVNNLVSAQTTHFTQYGILGTPNLSALDIKVSQPLPGIATTLSAAEPAGQTTLSVADASGFNVGDQIKITDSNTANEVFTISQVNDTDTDSLVVTSATTTDHASGVLVERVNTHTFHFTPVDVDTPIKYIVFDYTPITGPDQTEDLSFSNNGGKTTTGSEGTHTGVPAGSANFTSNGLITYTITTATALSTSIEMVFNHIKNPTTEGNYKVEITCRDESNAVVAQGMAVYNIKEGVSIQASVDPILSFTISGIAGGTSVGSGEIKDTTNITTTAISIPFGTLTSGTSKIGAQKLTIGTNADDGYTVTIQENESLKKTGSSTDIDDFSNNTGTPVPNSAPVYWASPISPYTGFFGYHTDDTTLGTGTANRFYGTYNKYAALSTTGYEVAYAPGPVASSSEEVTIVYKIEINDLQEAGDYTNVITYICTPIF